jgi:hypothetical protein
MKRAILSILCLVIAACSEDPARFVRIRTRDASPVTTVYTPPSGPDRNMIPEFCPPPGDSAGPSSLVATGPCEFQHRAPASCESSPDDFIVAIPRKAKNGATLVIYLNVEKYRGPGVYDGAQLFLAVQSGSIIYRWSNDQVRATVGPDEAFVTLPRTQLDPEPVRVECSRLIGPASNYQYQCAGTSDVNLELENVVEIVHGKLACGQRTELNVTETPHSSATY